MSVEALRCAGISRFVDTYLDGEFADKERAEFESHLAACESCRKRVRTQADWKAAIRAAAPREMAPASLRNQVLRQLRHEAARGKSQLSWRRWAIRAMPAAAAVGLVVTYALSSAHFSPLSSTMSSMFSTPTVAVDVARWHGKQVPLEVSGGNDQVRRWFENKVDFPVRVPEFHALPCALRGGRLATIGNKQGALLTYELNGDKLTVFVFDASGQPIEAPKKREVGGRETWFDQEHGYNVALFRDRGLGYALVSDLDQDELIKLVNAAVPK